MECPFELPIHINQIPCFSEEEVAYIVQVINSHEKLIEALKELRASDNWLHRLLKSCVIFLDDGDVTKRAVEKQSRYNQQALKEAEKKFGD